MKQNVNHFVLFMRLVVIKSALDEANKKLKDDDIGGIR